MKLWCSNKANVFCSSIERHNSNIKNIEELQYIIENGMDKDILNNVITKLCDVFLSASKDAFGLKHNKQHTKKNPKSPGLMINVEQRGNIFT